jgi:MOB kinase activator 1
MRRLQRFRYEYRWADGVQIKKPIEVSAPKYVEYLMDWIETQLDDETIFPQKLGKITLLWHIFDDYG